MRALLARLEGYFQRHEPIFLEVLRPGATKTKLAEFERALGVPAPRDLLEILAWHDGQLELGDDGLPGGEPLALQDCCYLQSTERILSHREFMREAARDEGRSWDEGWVPFLFGEGDGSLVLIDSRNGGHIFGMSPDDGVGRIEFDSLEHWLETFVLSLEAGMWKREDWNLDRVDEARIHRIGRAALASRPKRVV